MCKREELVQYIGKLHEQLVASVDAPVSGIPPDDTRLELERVEVLEVVEELVTAIKELKLLDAAPCATTLAVQDATTYMAQQKVADEGDCAWIKGFKAALRVYAWWKDGVQYVGCGVYTLEQELAGVDAEWTKQKGDGT